MKPSLSIPRLMITALMSGSGKTVLTSGLLAALAEPEAADAPPRPIQGFKVGPDFIDPTWHKAATGRASRNLDLWMLPPDYVRRSFAAAAADAEIAIIEGAMGLFDGRLPEGEGSPAEVAKLLGVPIVVVIDIGGMARSAGVLALGARLFDPDLNIAGVVLNNAASQRHAAAAQAAVEQAGLSVLGYLPRSPDLRIRERHLGLFLAEEQPGTVKRFLKTAAAMVQHYIDVPRLVEIAQSAPPLPIPEPLPTPEPLEGSRPRIGVALDQAFCFYYEDNFDLLRQAGAELVFFSPLGDDTLPPNLKGLYLGGGYPELHTEKLSRNAGMMADLRQAVQTGMPIYAECGGLMALSEGILDFQSGFHPLIGALPGHVRMTDHLRLGYRDINVQRDNLLLRQGESIRGHEFHYSNWEGRALNIAHPYRVEGQPEGFMRGDLLASYMHLHFGAKPEIARRFVEACAAWVPQPLPEPEQTVSAGDEVAFESGAHPEG